MNSEIIRPRTLHRRLLNEEKNLLINYPDSQLNLYEDYGTIDIIIKEIKIHLRFSEDYPFKPPTIWLNNIPYLTYLRSMFYKKGVFNNCPCCSSVLCGANWVPFHQSFRILDEIKENITNKQRKIYLLLIKKLKDKYLISDIPIEEFI